MDTKDTQVKKGIFELLSALCVYSAEGYSRALEALEHYKKFKSERYRFLIVLSELQTAKTAEYKTVLLAFINCLIISTPQLKVNNANRRIQYYSIYTYIRIYGVYLYPNFVSFRIETDYEMNSLVSNLTMSLSKKEKNLSRRMVEWMHPTSR